MVFNKNVTIEQIEKYENECLEKVCNLPLMFLLKEELRKRNFYYTIYVLHGELNLKKYSSHLAIDIFDDNGERIPEHDEPNCCLMLCEAVCYTHHGHIVGIDLVDDKKFLQSFESLFKQVQEY